MDKVYKPEKLALDSDEVDESPEFTDGVGDEALNRFDRAKKKKKKNKNRNNDKKQQDNNAPKEGQSRHSNGGNGAGKSNGVQQ